MSETNEFVPGGYPASSGPAPRRGRPTNAEIAARNAAPQVQPARVEAEKKQRRRRADTSETRNLKLHVPESMKDPNFVYRWVNDTAAGRIHDKTVNDDWEIASLRDSENKEVQAVRNVGNGEHGQPLKSYLLRKPKEFHEEDKARSIAALKETEKQLERGKSVGAGGLEESVSYVPGGADANRIGR